MPSRDQVEANREMQRVEARTRDNTQQSEADRNLSAEAQESTVEDGGESAAPPAEPISQQPAPEPESRRPQVRGPFDDRRAQIINSFREHRTHQAEEADANDNELRDLANGGLPPELTEAVDRRENVPSPPQPQESGEAPTPTYQQSAPAEEERRHKLVVRGKEVWVTDAELLEHAQKSYGRDDYLGEARNLMEENRRRMEELNQRISQFSGQHQPQGTHPAQEQVYPASAAPAEPPSPQEDPLDKVIDSLQYGDKEEAKTALRQVLSNIVQSVPAASAEEVRRQRMQAEHGVSMRTLENFQRTNEGLVSDVMAQAAMRARLLELQREDLKNLGISEDRIPKNPDQLAQTHLQFRTDRLNVRNVDQLLDQAKKDYEGWRGRAEQQQQQPTDQPVTQPRAAQPPQQQQPQQPQPNKVEISLNREARRAVIPQQPERTVTPRPQPQAQTQAAQPDRTSVVQGMQRRRQVLRGVITG